MPNTAKPPSCPAYDATCHCADALLKAVTIACSNPLTWVRHTRRRSPACCPPLLVAGPAPAAAPLHRPPARESQRRTRTCPPPASTQGTTQRLCHQVPLAAEFMHTATDCRAPYPSALRAWLLQAPLHHPCTPPPHHTCSVILPSSRWMSVRCPTPSGPCTQRFLSSAHSFSALCGGSNGASSSGAVGSSGSSGSVTGNSSVVMDRSRATRI